MAGQLFKQYFLTDGIRETPEWRESMKHAEGFIAFTHAISTCFNNFSHFSNPNEAVTEKELICPVLEALGWSDYLPQQGVARNEDIPDHLLFADADAKKRAIARSNSQDRYKDALLLQESKRLSRSLDNREEGDKVQEGTPHGQILRYLPVSLRASRSVKTSLGESNCLRLWAGSSSAAMVSLLGMRAPNGNPLRRTNWLSAMRIYSVGFNPSRESMASASVLSSGSIRICICLVLLITITAPPS